MKVFKISALLVFLLVSATRADPVSACTNLVGTYAEATDPGDPEFTVSCTNRVFFFVDLSGKTKVKGVTPTERGLVFVEDEDDPNKQHFRLSYDPKLKSYFLEYLGRVKPGQPVPTEAGFKSKFIKVAVPSKKKPKG